MSATKERSDLYKAAVRAVDASYDYGRDDSTSGAFEAYSEAVSDLFALIEEVPAPVPASAHAANGGAR